MLECTKRQHWQHWLEKVEDPDIWTAHKYMSSPARDGGKSRIPVLKLTHHRQEHVASSNEEKSNLLVKIFFPPGPQTPAHCTLYTQSQYVTLTPSPENKSEDS
jgi:hypothetical protein